MMLIDVPLLLSAHAPGRRVDNTYGLVAIALATISGDSKGVHAKNMHTAIVYLVHKYLVRNER